MSESTTTEPAARTNPLRMLALGVVSLLMGVTAAPVVVQVIYPLMTLAKPGDEILIDGTGAFVVTSTLFVAFYKLFEVSWTRFRGPDVALRPPETARGVSWLGWWCETLRRPFLQMFGVVVGLWVVLWLMVTLFIDDDSQPDTVEASAVVEPTDDCYTDTDDAAPLPRDTNRYAIALLSDTANAGDRDKYNHCRYLSVLNPSQDAPQQP